MKHRDDFTPVVKQDQKSAAKPPGTELFMIVLRSAILPHMSSDLDQLAADAMKLLR
jgi:hypothetical protein